MAKNGRMVYQREDGMWVNKRNDSDRAPSLHKTQKQAEAAAKKMLKNQGGGEVTIKDMKGKIINKDTVKPAKDPYPPKG